MCEDMKEKLDVTKFNRSMDKFAGLIDRIEASILRVSSQKQSLNQKKKNHDKQWIVCTMENGLTDNHELLQTESEAREYAVRLLRRVPISKVAIFELNALCKIEMLCPHNSDADFRSDHQIRFNVVWNEVSSEIKKLKDQVDFWRKACKTAGPSETDLITLQSSPGEHGRTIRSMARSFLKLRKLAMEDEPEGDQ